MRIEYLYVVKWHFMNNYRLIVCRDAADIGTASRRQQHRATEPALTLTGMGQETRHYMTNSSLLLSISVLFITLCL